MPTTARNPDTLTTDLIHVVAGLDAEPWKLRPDGDDRAKLLVGDHAARVRGTLDGAGYVVRESDVPVREGFDALFDVSRSGGER